MQLHQQQQPTAEGSREDEDGVQADAGADLDQAGCIAAGP